MALTEVTNGTLASTVGATTNIFNVTATPGIYVAKLNVSNYARWNSVIVGMQDALPDGTATAETVYQDTFPKGSDGIAYTPPFPTASFFNLFVYTPTAAANIPWSVMTLGVPTRVSHGSVTLTGTAQQLGAAMGPGVYMAKVDLGVMANGDEVLFFVNDQVIAGAGVTSWAARYANAQRFPVKHTPPLPIQVTGAGLFYAYQPAGTFRTIGYEILKLT